jgi:glycosyltransferase involved in cell wall biosynthesis
MIKVLNIEPFDASLYCEIPQVDFLPYKDPPISAIVPYKCGKPLNKIWVCENDEVIVVRGGPSIGHARIAGAKHAKNEWIVQLDSDAVYPPEYILLVKHYIRELGETYPIMCTRRVGGFGNLFWNVIESGLVVRKDIFLQRGEQFLKSRRTWAFSGEGRYDVGDYFHDAQPIPVYYYHPLAISEKIALGLVGATLLVGIGYLIAKKRRRW